VIKRLDERSGDRVFRSDSIAISGAPSSGTAPARRFVRGPFWADYVVKV
jgi:hypothetical protein